jgi:hypothetical protein
MFKWLRKKDEEQGSLDRLCDIVDDANETLKEVRRDYPDERFTLWVERDCHGRITLTVSRWVDRCAIRYHPE